MYDKLPQKYKDVFSEARWNDVCKIVEEQGIKVRSNQFTAPEIELIISETALSDKLKEGAKLHYVNHVKIKDLCIRYGYDKSGIEYYKKKVSLALRTTCTRIFKN